MELDETVRRKLYISFILIGVCFPLAIFIFLQFFFIKSFAKANIQVNTTQITAPINRDLKIGGKETKVTDSAAVVRIAISKVQDQTELAAAEKMYKDLEGYRLKVTGEGDFVKAVATRTKTKHTLMLVNFDEKNKNKEVVPITFTNLANGSYTVRITTLGGTTTGTEEVRVENKLLKRSVFMKPNQITIVKLQKKQ